MNTIGGDFGMCLMDDAGNELTIYDVLVKITKHIQSLIAAGDTKLIIDTEYTTSLFKFAGVSYVRHTTAYGHGRYVLIDDLMVWAVVIDYQPRFLADGRHRITSALGNIVHNGRYGVYDGVHSFDYKHRMYTARGRHTQQFAVEIHNRINRIRRPEGVLARMYRYINRR